MRSSEAFQGLALSSWVPFSEMGNGMGRGARAWFGPSLRCQVHTQVEIGKEATGYSRLVFREKGEVGDTRLDNEETKRSVPVWWGYKNRSIPESLFFHIWFS